MQPSSTIEISDMIILVPWISHGMGFFPRKKNVLAKHDLFGVIQRDPFGWDF